MTDATSRLAGIRLHPIKSLDAVSVTESRIGPGGGLEFDRVWALYSPDGECINGKSTAAIQRIRAAFAPDVSAVTLSAPDDRRDLASQTFVFPRDVVRAQAWFSAYFQRPVVVRHVVEGAPDDTRRNGPMVVSTATLEAVSTWFPDIDVEEARRRLRTPLEIGGVGAFWEDRLFDVQETEGIPFTVGDVTFEGVNPCPRCVVTSRDSRSGMHTSGFEKRFSELRRTHYPKWARRSERIQHFYHLGINTRVAPPEYGKVLRVGDEVSCSDSRSR